MNTPRPLDTAQSNGTQLLTDEQLENLADFELIEDDLDNAFNATSTSMPWHILVVDDDEEVHASTDFALKGVTILDRPISISHAFSAEEGFQLLQEGPEFSVALLDVVMESDDAGLKLVQKIRHEKFDELRIVLRTGQPGYAPELSVLHDYDINDYRTKTDLTRNRLISLLTTSCRSYRQLHIIKESRRGLALIVESARDIFKRKNLYRFSQGVLTQLTTLLDAPSDGLVCLMADDNIQSPDAEAFKVVTATGVYTDLNNQPLNAIDDPRLVQAFHKARRNDIGIYLDNALGLYFSSHEGKNLFVYVNATSGFSEELITLLKIFASNIAIGFDNLALVEKLDQLAYIDTVLGIPNRNAFALEFDRLQQEGKTMSIALVHINGLSQCISAFGMDVVNKAIIKIRQSLEESLTPKPHLVAYDGKTDFIIVADVDTINTEHIAALFDSKVVVDQFSLPFGATISIVNTDQSMDAQRVLRCATSALLIAKKTPATNVMHYDQSMTQGLTERILLQTALRNDLDSRRGIEAYLQPKVRCSDGVLIGAEALCRWNLEGRFIPPSDFIPIAEASGLSTKITEHMIQFVSDFTKSRAKKGLPELPIAVNLSMHDLQAHSFAINLMAKLQSLELNPQRIEFEVTESATMNDPSHAIKELSILHEAGYVIAIDDFGTGYSSLNYLERLPVRTLKIDKTFIDTLDVRSAKRSLAAAAISLAELKGLFVVAEGIETKEQHEALKFLGCDACQGYYFAKPLPMAEFDSAYDLDRPLLPMN